MESTLINLRKNEKGLVRGVEGGQGIKQQLSLRGLSEGVLVRMIDCSCGPVVLDINGSTLAIGRGIAGRIIIDRC
ncbi:Fe2+ transport system protein FeoA [Methanomicrobium sp. W14]|uniref:FeoA family protein n=1 Tax=Methanomicrobium sp. W14 TaxID=2817839 RepID=UPI001AE1AFF2|nr:FeoA family protein [Methanomicrobium sp. W14]MBP2133305.1 Fe2+ transport system protein FeoA [Methanomicrobium sp. W14]